MLTPMIPCNAETATRLGFGCFPMKMAAVDGRMRTGSPGRRRSLQRHIGGINGPTVDVLVGVLSASNQCVPSCWSAASQSGRDNASCNRWMTNRSRTRCSACMVDRAVLSSQTSSLGVAPPRRSLPRLGSRSSAPSGIWSHVLRRHQLGVWPKNFAASDLDDALRRKPPSRSGTAAYSRKRASTWLRDH